MEHEHAHHEHNAEHHVSTHQIRHTSQPTNPIQKIGQFLWENKNIIILLIAIFLLAFGIRAHLLRYDYLFEFDAFFHARVVQDLVTQGHLSNPDPLAYYEIPGGVSEGKVSGYHVISAILYEILAFGQPFNKELFTWTIQFFPIVFGSIIAILLYFLGKEVFNNKKVGLIMAFVGAVTPAFAYRTMAGAQGDNSFGFIWFVLGFIFLIRGVKVDELNKSTLTNTILAGIMFGLMSMSWNMYLLIPLVVIFYGLFAIYLIAAKDNSHHNDLIKNHAFIFAVKIILAMGIFHVMCYWYGENWIVSALGYIGQAAHLGVTTTVVGFIVASIISIIACVFIIPKTSKETKSLVVTLTILGLYAGFIVMLFVFMTVPDLMDRSTIGSMVGEESVGNSFFGTKYNELIVFPWIALIFLPISLWLFKKEDSHTKILLFFWVIITLFMAWYKLKFTFVFGLAIAPAAAIVTYLILEGLKKFEIERGIESKILIGAVLLIAVLGVGASARFFPDYVPYVDEHPEWQAAQQWIIQNTPTDAKLFNWWDQGHILTYVTERKVSTDNRNGSDFANKEMAEFVTTTDTNRGYIIASSEVGADYVLLDSSMFASAPTFEYYVKGSTKVDPKIMQKYYSGTIRVLNCTGADNNSSTISCEGNSIPRSQWELFSTKWKATPDDFQNGSDAIFYYRTNDQLLIMNDAMNKTNLVKVWTNSDETSNYYEDTYSKGGIKILKIIK